MKNFLTIFLMSFVIFFFSWLTVYKTGINTLAIQSEDTLPAIFMPVTILKEGTLYVDTYYEMLRSRYPQPDDPQNIKGLTPFYLRKIVVSSNTETRLTENGMMQIYYPQRENQFHYVSAFPIISGLLALPVYVVPLVLNMQINWPNLIILSHISASLIMALAVAFFYLLVSRFFVSEFPKHLVSDNRVFHKIGTQINKIIGPFNTPALLLTIIYAFATINFSSISQSLWQHGTVQLFTILTMYFMFLAFESYNQLSTKQKHQDLIWHQYLRINLMDHLGYIFFAGFFLTMAVISRPTSAIIMPFLALLIYQVYIHQPRNLIQATVFLIAGMMPPTLFLFWYNAKYYLSVQNQGYVVQATSGWQSNILEGFAGLWLSPSKGMLVYSPVLVFAFLGLLAVYRRKKWHDDIKYIIFACIVIFHMLVLGYWKHWYGGWSYGYRMASDILPFMVLLLVPYLQSSLFQKTKKLFIVLLLVSIGIQLLGIIFFDGVWHAAYDRGFSDTGWLWSIRDSEFAFTARRVFVKFGMLDVACPKCAPWVSL
jgi:hypothetical protein